MSRYSKRPTHFKGNTIGKTKKYTTKDLKELEVRRNQYENRTTLLLQPRYDSRKSFYQKAKVEVFPGEGKKLYSYNTLVAETKNGRAHVYNTQSQTTLRHVKEFLRQEGYEVGSKDFLWKKYGAST